MTQKPVDTWGDAPKKEKVSFYLQSSTLDRLRTVNCMIDEEMSTSKVVDYCLMLGMRAHIEGWFLVQDETGEWLMVNDHAE